MLYPAALIAQSGSLSTVSVNGAQEAFAANDRRPSVMTAAVAPGGAPQGHSVARKSNTGLGKTRAWFVPGYPQPTGDIGTRLWDFVNPDVKRIQGAAVQRDDPEHEVFGHGRRPDDPRTIQVEPDVSQKRRKPWE